MNLLVLGYNELFSRWVTVALATAGHRVRVMSPGNHRLARFSRHCSGHAPCDLELSLRHLETYCRDHHVDWIVPADLPATRLVSRWNSDLKGPRAFPVSPPELIERLNDKWEFFRLLRELGLPSPETRLLESAAAAAALPLTFPLMIKPLRNEGGVGVRRIESRAELSAMLDAHGAKHGWPLLAQDFIPGSDIDLSVLADRGRVVAWTIQRRTPEPKGALEFLHHPRVLEIGSALVQSTRYHGVVHFDMRLEERTKEPMVVEANPRFWGSLRHSVWAGVNFPALGLAMAQGIDVGRQFTPVAGNCWDPGFSVLSFARALMKGKLRPERWSSATETGWRCNLTDPVPAIWERVQTFTRRRAPAPAPAL